MRKAPVNWNDFRCLDEDWAKNLPEAYWDKNWAGPAIFDDRLGENSRYVVNDDGDRFNMLVMEGLNDADADGDGYGDSRPWMKWVEFYGHSVASSNSSRQERAVEGNDATGDGANAGWINRGNAQNAVVFEVNDWDSQYLTTWIAAILMKEKVGHNVAFVRNKDPAGFFERAASGSNSLSPVHANMEVWPAGKDPYSASWPGFVEWLGGNGVVGRSGIYASSDLVNVPEFIDFWQGLNEDVVIEHSSLPHPLFTENICADESCFVCQKNSAREKLSLPKMNCVNGSFTTATCKTASDGLSTGGSENCTSVIMMNTEYDAGLYQQIAQRVGLKSQLVFMEQADAEDYVLAKLRAGRPVVFYHWWPTVFHSQHGADWARVMFPESSPACLEMNDGTPNGGVNCDLPQQALSKYVSGELSEQAPMAYAFIRNFHLNQDIANELLQNYADDTVDDGFTHYRTACAWVKENYGTWSKWLPEQAACLTKDFAYTVSNCDAVSQLRTIHYEWVQPKTCWAGEALPEDMYIECDEVLPGSYYGLASAGLHFISFVIALGFIAWVFIRRNSIIVQVGQRTLCTLFCFGAVVLNLAGLLTLGQNTDATCLLRVWLLNVGSSLMIGCLLLKVLRVWRIFSADPKKPVMMPLRTTLKLLFAIIALDCSVLLAWTIIDPPSAVNFLETTPGIGAIEHTVCRPGNVLFFAILVLFKVVWVVMVGVMCYISRKFDENFAESNRIGLAVYSLSLFSLMTLVVGFLDPGLLTYHMVRSLSISLSTSIAVTVVLQPKIAARRKFENVQDLVHVMDKSIKAHHLKVRPKNKTKAGDSEEVKRLNERVNKMSLENSLLRNRVRAIESGQSDDLPSLPSRPVTPVQFAEKAAGGLTSAMKKARAAVVVVGQEY